MGQINDENSSFNHDRGNKPKSGAGFGWEDSVAFTQGHRTFPGTDRWALAFNGTDDL